MPRLQTPADPAMDSGVQSRARVIIADADPVARRVVRAALQEGRQFIVAAEAGDGVETVELALYYRPELVLMESALPRLDGIDATRQITEAAPEVRVIIFSAARDEQLELRALLAGASGFLSKEVELEGIARAMRVVLRGEAAVSPMLSMSLIEHLRAVPEAGQGMRPVRSGLTTREWVVLDLMSSGSSTNEIADELVLTQDTIYSHVKNIMRKLDVHTRGEAIAAAQRLCHP